MRSLQLLTLVLFAASARADTFGLFSHTSTGCAGVSSCDPAAAPALASVTSDFGALAGGGGGETHGDGPSYFGVAEGSWQDTLTVTSDSLPAGTPVNLALTTLSILNFENCLGISSVSDNVPGHFGCNTLRAGQFDVIGPEWEQVTNTTILPSFVGDVVSISDSLKIQYSVGGTQDPADLFLYSLFFDPNLFSLFDIGTHKQFNVDVLTPGADYITASGHNYASGLSSSGPPPIGSSDPPPINSSGPPPFSSSVPEPSAPVLLMTALALLAIVRTWKRTKA